MRWTHSSYLPMFTMNILNTVMKISWPTWIVIKYMAILKFSYLIFLSVGFSNIYVFSEFGFGAATFLDNKNLSPQMTFEKLGQMGEEFEVTDSKDAVPLAL